MNSLHGFANMLTILFIGLKLTDFIGWHWAWVMAPFWGYLALAFLVSVVFVGAAQKMSS